MKCTISHQVMDDMWRQFTIGEPEEITAENSLELERKTLSRLRALAEADDETDITERLPDEYFNNKQNSQLIQMIRDSFENMGHISIRFCVSPNNEGPDMFPNIWIAVFPSEYPRLAGCVQLLCEPFAEPAPLEEV